MNTEKQIRYGVISAILLFGVYCPIASAISSGVGGDYPNAGFLATTEWLKSQKNNTSLVTADVRTDKYFKGKLIPGVVRMPWRLFQHDNIAGHMGGLFGGFLILLGSRLAVGFGFAPRALESCGSPGEPALASEQGSDAETSSDKAEKGG